ncbi:cache domain-containing sensor histidine kinase [Gallintestinimicrobium sp.]|uniref:cache domain-containing sensor histidine kinase n=1 Tax=Gallintestinimicrobium sp. TaxID=2981655 RepID=UPI003AF9E695
MQNKMKKLLHWFNGIKLRYKLAIFYSLFCFLPVMLLFWLSFLQMRSIIDDKGKMNLQSYLQQSVSSMDRTLDGYNSLSDYIAFDRTLAEVFSMEYGTPYEQYEQLTQKVDPILRTASYFHGGMQQITIYTDNGMVKHDTTVAPVSEIEETDWYQKTLEHPGLNRFANYQEETLFFARKLAFSGAREGVNILYMDVDYQKLFTPYAETLISECGLYITDQDGKLVFEESRFSGKNQNYDLTYSEFLEQRDRGSTDYIILCEQSNTTGWTVWLYQPVGLAGEAMRPIGVMAGVTILICIFAAVLAYFITSGMVSSRIERLTHFMQEVQEGSMDMQMESDDRDEIGMLYRGFGSMMKRIRTLINEVYLSKITQKEAELKALQAQINPHFLYNTLSLINWKALAAGEEDISRMTLALSTFYRTALNRGRNVLQVETELSNTRAYLEIQSMLHDGDFDYEIEAQTEILQCESLNLILQPLVENAIHHGIEEKTDGRGKITVRGWKEDNCVWFMVEDNGVGMEQEVADKILTMESKGYGVRNVDERIRLCYGEKYAMKVESVVGKGTKMTIHFPARRLTNIQKSQIS